MSRDVPFDKDVICDKCGAVGAFDFMGDFICPVCLENDCPQCDICGTVTVQMDTHSYACPSCGNRQ